MRHATAAAAAAAAAARTTYPARTTYLSGVGHRKISAYLVSASSSPSPPSLRSIPISTGIARLLRRGYYSSTSATASNARTTSCTSSHYSVCNQQTDNTSRLEQTHTRTQTQSSKSDSAMAERSTDDDYSAFLEKASESTSSGAQTKSTSGDKSHFTTRTVSPARAGDDVVPEQISKALAAKKGDEPMYTSETDEPFHAVSLPSKASKAGRLDADSFANTVGVSASKVEQIEQKQFDRAGEFKALFDALAAAAADNAQPAVFRVQLQGARCEYWLVALAPSPDKSGKDQERLVGFKVAAVES